MAALYWRRHSNPGGVANIEDIAPLHKNHQILDTSSYLLDFLKTPGINVSIPIHSVFDVTSVDFLKLSFNHVHKNGYCDGLKLQH